MQYSEVNSTMRIEFYDFRKYCTFIIQMQRYVKYMKVIPRFEDSNYSSNRGITWLYHANVADKFTGILD